MIAVPLFRRAGFRSVPGYLAAGLAIGPFGLGFFQDAQSIILHDPLQPKPVQSMDGVGATENLSGTVLLIIGFGRFGQIVSQPVLARGHSLSIIETSTEAIRDAEDFGLERFRL